MSDKKGTRATEALLKYVINLGEAIAKADRNGDGKVSSNEAFGIATQHGFQLFSHIKDAPEVAEEIKDLDILELTTLARAGVEEIDSLTERQRDWVVESTRSVADIVRLAKEASSVWQKS